MTHVRTSQLLFQLDHRRSLIFFLFLSVGSLQINSESDWQVRVNN